MDRTDPTEKQAEVLRVYVEHFQAHQRYPTLDEASEALGVWPNAVKQHLNALKKKGWLEFDARRTGVRVVGLELRAVLPGAPWRHEQSCEGAQT